MQAMSINTVAAIRHAARDWRDRPELRVSSDPADVESVTIRYLMYVLMPAWFVPGVTDYFLHRRTRIEATSGLRESAIHSLMMGEIAVPVTLTLLFEVNPLVLALAVAAGGVHEATAIWDVRAAVNGGREVGPAEQHVHSFLESLPFMAISALLCLHWDQVAGAWRAPAARDWRLRPRRRRLPGRYLAAIGAGIGALIAVPYGEELWRCARAARVASKPGRPRG
jgi:hypothetical protein